MSKLSSVSNECRCLSLRVLLGRGKQWQTTPKNLPRMQHTRATPVARLSSGLCPDRPNGWIPIIIIILLGEADLCLSLVFIHKEQVIWKKGKKKTPEIFCGEKKKSLEWDIGQGPQLAVMFCVLWSVNFRQRPSVQPAKGVQQKTKMASNKERVTSHGLLNHKGVNNINGSVTR